ncbi:DEAD-box ATP-dependent RNA helicase 7 [Zea mays]|uniref:DEAD-box ATP-dependent RNA helicase 7 n=1 Tax=Zea mays TaxID=4577 RepID=A0A3L6G237_MAIZE|nr:DEAD-box ATP-dependent RNA helicase 7 [Zea mays]
MMELSTLLTSVLTPYFKEEVLFSPEDLHRKNEDGISILFYLRKIYPDEFRNFLQRIDFKLKDEEELKERMDEICNWASYRGQILTRTVRGMMYYRKALEIQCLQDMTDPAKVDRDRSIESYQELQSDIEMAQAIADIKFTYVVSCQVYGMQKTSKDLNEKRRYQNILSLMIMNPSLRVAFIDEVEAPTRNGATKKTYYSVLVKGGEKYDEVEDATKVQMLLFSATLSDWVNKETVDLVGNEKLKASASVKHLVLPCNKAARAQVIPDIIRCYSHGGRTIIFTKTKDSASELSGLIPGSRALHGDVAQAQREVILAGFCSGKFQVLVATNVAARGLDINDVQLIIQFKLCNGRSVQFDVGNVVMVTGGRNTGRVGVIKNWEKHKGIFEENIEWNSNLVVAKVWRLEFI